ncbi:glycosyltransferase family 4 protein [Halostella sp. JP-L12]|uniref:glycosyltransferase family 4 protein n=1 Tax=Halostella TaxID=1843185 RepID=UPI000EF7B591|nr:MULTISPECIES: glycosyltransferase family 4 protein [Halostella]NHN47647.1 glycosyltransferase family 4 protein [Halostella sp. JP-L12]
MRVAVASLETWKQRDTEALRRLRRVAESLANRGHDVHVLCSQWWDGYGDRREEGDITYHGVVVSPDARQSFLLRLPVAIASVRPDIVHAGALPPAQVTPASIGSTLARCPLIVEWYGDEEAAAGSARSRRWAVRRPDVVVTPSRLVKTEVREAGADGDDVRVIPDSIDVERIRDTEPDDRGSLVYARRLDEGANLESMLLALAELRDRDWSATVIGDGPRREEYEQQARDLRIDDRVEFVGSCSRDERIAIYRGAHVFVQTARRSPFATELLWGLASGCVGIVEYHAESSAHELVENRPRGFRTTSEQELADAIVDAGRLDRLDLDESFASYDRDAVLEEYLECYRTLREGSGLF